MPFVISIVNVNRVPLATEIWAVLEAYAERCVVVNQCRPMAACTASS